MLLYAEFDGTPACLDPLNLTVLRQLRVPGEHLSASLHTLAVSPDGTLLATLSRVGRSVRLWDLLNERLLLTLGFDDAWASTLAFAPDGRTLAVTRENGTILFAVDREDVCWSVTPHRGQIHDVCWTAGGASLAYLGTGLQGRIPDEVRLRPAFSAVVDPRPGPAMALWGAPFRDRQRLAGRGDGLLAVGEASGVTLWQPGGSPTRALPVWAVSTLRFGPDGRLWTAGAEIQVWKTDGSEDRQAVSVAVHKVEALAVGRRWALAGSRDGMVHVLRAEDAQSARSWTLDEGPVLSLALVGDERLALAGTQDGSLCLLTPPDGQPVVLPQAHTAAVEAVAFVGPDLAASGGRDGTVRLWRLADGGLRPVLTWRIGGPVLAIEPSPDGAALAVLVAGERAPRVWRLGPLGEKLAALGIDSGLPRRGLTPPPPGAEGV
jgi:WD40 repeat protein